MRRFGYINALYLSFFSKDFYTDVAKNWAGTGLFYLFILITLSWLPDIINLQTEITRFIDTNGPGIVEQIPTITISEGRASIDATMPYVITYPGTDSSLAIIDTAGQDDALFRSEAVILLTGKEIVIKQDSTELQAFELDLLLGGVEQFIIDRQVVSNLMETTKTWFAPVVFLALTISSFALRAFQAFIFAAIGTFFTRVFPLRLKFCVLLRLSAIALTPLVIIEIFAALAGISLSKFGFIQLFLSMGYMFYAVKVNLETVDLQ